ncbi:MAG: hypothetical protein H3C62_05785 [Gemmatimonadaceae bacterium]|nr:hypothetical protein [Gemmatimonadaceae bacterium]
MYEHRTAPLLPRHLFWRRMLRHGGAALVVVTLSLVGGTIGYHTLGDLPWVSAFENASMILGGMGPVDPIARTSGKLFASFFALYSGVVFLLVAGLLATPVLHRLLHRFHLEQSGRAK